MSLRIGTSAHSKAVFLIINHANKIVVMSQAWQCMPVILEVEEGGSGVEGYLWLHSEFESSLGSVRSCHKQTILAVTYES